ncbi:3828_t:CDS:2 [Gigaspora rosea]|nr:3828_t:CDS:2 [Gigaspora rosea]
MTPHFYKQHLFNQYVIENAANYFEQTSLQKEDQNIDLDELPKRCYKKEDWNLDFDELPQFASNQHIMIELEKAADYFEQTTLQKEDRNLDFDELPQRISNQYTTMKFEKTPDDLEPILEDSEDPFIDFNKLEHNYAEYKGFEVRRGRIMTINGAKNEKIILKRTIDCKYSGVYKPKNPEKPGTLVQQMCQWHVNLSRPKNESNAKPYLEHRLYKRRFAWARAFSTLAFTLGIQSTSFVESQNSCIKRVISNSNISLCDIGKILIERSDKERKHKLIEEWRSNIPNTTSVSTVFPTIESLVKKYLRPNVSRFLIEQMKESVYYVASRTTIETESLKVQEPSTSDDFNDEYNSAFMCAKYLLEHLESNTIEEVWNISRVTRLVCRHFFNLLNVTDKARFSLQLIARHWISKDQWLDASKECVHHGQRFNNNTSLDTNISILDNDTSTTALKSNKEKFKWLCPFNSNNSVEEININDVFVEEQLFYENVWGLVRTAMDKCLQYRDQEFVHFIEDYLKRIREREEELIKAQEVRDNVSVNNFNAQHTQNAIDKENIELSIN